jgi:hypothetical protein
MREQDLQKFLNDRTQSTVEQSSDFEKASREFYNEVEKLLKKFESRYGIKRYLTWDYSKDPKEKLLKVSLYDPS